MKLRTKILLLLFPLITIPLLLTGWLAYNELKQISEQKTFKQVNNTFTYMKNDFDSILNTSKANIELFSSNKLLQEYLLTEDEQQRYYLFQKPLLAQFKSYQDSYPQYYEIRILLTDGYEDIRKANRAIDNITEQESDTEYFQFIQSSAADISTSLFKNPDNDEFSLYVSKRVLLRDPIQDPIGSEPKLRGYLLLTVDIKFLRDYLYNENTNLSSFLFITDRHGEYIFKSRNVPYTEKKILPEISEHFFSLVNNKSFQLIHSLNKSFYFKGIKLHDNIYAFVGIPMETFSQVSYHLAMVVTGITLVTLLVTMLSSYVVLNNIILDPIQKLGAATRQISAGHYIIDPGEVNDDEIGELTLAFADMGKSIQDSSNKIKNMAYHDHLTGLPNRNMFHDSLQKLLKQTKRNREKLAILYLDIDDFKHINDTLGHQIGDMFLKDVSKRLSSLLREDDYLTYMESSTESKNNFVARLGGDEFIVVLPRQTETLAAAGVAERLLSELSKPFRVKNQEFFVGASIGITIFPNDGEDADELIKHADIAMYHAKEMGKNNYKYFSESLNFTLKRKLSLESNLRKALDRNWLNLHYQPIIDVKTGAITGLEALCRWNDPELGLISPDEFIPLAEESGLIHQLGQWVIEEACRQNKAWQDEGLPKLPMAINVSSIQFDRRDLVTCIEKALNETQLSAQYLTIEITESSIMASPEKSIDVLQKVKALGVNISLDDFGSGYSSLACLRTFPIDTLKIDRSFAEEMSKKSDKATIVSAIMLMAHTLHLKVTAEGIQEASQLEYLKVHNCDNVQGYFFSRPLPAEQIPQLMAAPTLKTA